MPAEGVMNKAIPPLFWKSSDGSALQEVFQERNEWVSEGTVLPKYTGVIPYGRFHHWAFLPVCQDQHSQIKEEGKLYIT